MDVGVITEWTIGNICNQWETRSSWDVKNNALSANNVVLRRVLGIKLQGDIHCFVAILTPLPFCVMC